MFSLMITTVRLQLTSRNLHRFGTSVWNIEGSTTFQQGSAIFFICEKKYRIFLEDASAGISTLSRRKYSWEFYPCYIVLFKISFFNNNTLTMTKWTKILQYSMERKRIHPLICPSEHPTAVSCHGQLCNKKKSNCNNRITFIIYSFSFYLSKLLLKDSTHLIIGRELVSGPNI